MSHRHLRKLSGLILMTISLTASAYDSIVLWMKDGSNIVIPFTERPQINFNGDRLEIDSHTFNFSEISKYTIGSTSSIEWIETDGNGVTIDADGDVIIGCGIKPNEIAIYGTDGIKYDCKVNFTDNGALKIRLSTLSPQIYVIKAGTRTFKIRKA